MAGALCLTVHPKDKTPKEHECGTIYNITCDIESSHTYIGETKRTLGQRFKEHTNLDKPTGVGDHCRATVHSVSMKNTKVLTRESNWHKRKVKEAIYIRQRAPIMDWFCSLLADAHIWGCETPFAIYWTMLVVGSGRIGGCCYLFQI